MNDEIKEILDYLSKSTNSKDFVGMMIRKDHLDKLLNYITNLQEELEDLKEDNYAYHQLMRMQNKREYRSKFLKEFQEEFGTNTFPDYDEIYKRYDKLKKENKKLKEKCDYLKRSCDRKEEQRDDARMEYMEQEDYKSRCEKAIEYIKEEGTTYLNLANQRKWCSEFSAENILKILGGE